MDFAESNPIDELKALDEQVEKANDLAVLRPIFYRLDEIVLEHADNFPVQLAAGDVKQHLVSRGIVLKEESAAREPLRTPVFPDVQPAPPPPSWTDLGATTVMPMPTGFPGAPSAMAQTTPVPAESGSVSPLAAPAAPWRLEPPPRSRLGLWVAAGAILAVASAVMVIVSVKGNPFASKAIAVQVTTVPPGASVRVNGEAKCTSDCKLSIPPGDYEIAAVLDGYEPASSRITVVAGQQSSLRLPLEAQPQTVRILTDFPRGQITLDRQPPADLQMGTYTLEKLPPGLHTIKVTGSNGEASFSFDLAQSRQPSISGTVATRNVLAVLVASFAGRARVVTSSGPWKLLVNRQSENDAGPSGVDLKSFPAGPNELEIAQGNQHHSLKQSFGPTPTLTAFLKTDLDTGTLVVATGEDGVRVWVNGKEHLSQRGPLRIRAIGPVLVRVSKDGFEDPPLQTAEIRKGSETRLEFRFKPR
jgi:hypothetical protein